MATKAHAKKSKKASKPAARRAAAAPKKKPARPKAAAKAKKALKRRPAPAKAAPPKRKKAAPARRPVKPAKRPAAKAAKASARAEARRPAKKRALVAKKRPAPARRPSRPAPPPKPARSSKPARSARPSKPARPAKPARRSAPPKARKGSARDVRQVPRDARQVPRDLRQALPRDARQALPRDARQAPPRKGKEKALKPKKALARDLAREAKVARKAVPPPPPLKKGKAAPPPPPPPLKKGKAAPPPPPPPLKKGKAAPPPPPPPAGKKGKGAPPAPPSKPSKGGKGEHGAGKSATPARPSSPPRRSGSAPPRAALREPPRVAAIPLPTIAPPKRLSMEERAVIIEKRLAEQTDDFRKRYNDSFLMSWIYHDAALEGVVYTFEELRGGLTGQPVPTGDSGLQPTFDDIRRTKEAVEYVRDLAEKKRLPITVDVIKKLYLILHPEEGDIKTVKYRKDIPQHRLYFHEYAPPDKVAYKVRQIVDWLNDPETRKTRNLVRIAARVHYDLLRVYPFPVDSGKVARLFMNLMLMRGGMPPAIVHSTERQRYYEALKGSANTVLQMVQEAVENSLASVEKLLDEHESKKRAFIS